MADNHNEVTYIGNIHKKIDDNSYNFSHTLTKPIMTDTDIDDNMHGNDGITTHIHHNQKRGGVCSETNNSKLNRKQNVSEKLIDIVTMCHCHIKWQSQSQKMKILMLAIVNQCL